MKKLIVLLMIFVGCGPGIMKASAQTSNSGVIDIIDANKIKMPKPDEGQHKHHDLAVYKTMEGNDLNYSVAYYLQKWDVIRYFGATYGAHDDLDKAAYTWVNDSLLSLRLYSTTGAKKEINFQVRGSGRNSELIIDDGK